MKTINNDHYFEFLNKKLNSKISDVSTYLYIGLIVITGIFCVFNKGWERTSNISLILASGFLCAWMVYELIFVLIKNKTFNRNLWLTFFIFCIGLIPLNFLFLEASEWYLSFKISLIILVPVSGFILILEVSSRFNK